MHLLNFTFSQLDWWITLFGRIRITTPLEENEDELYNDRNYSDEAEEYFLDKFRNFMNNQDVSKFKIHYIRGISMS